MENYKWLRHAIPLLDYSVRGYYFHSTFKENRFQIIDKQRVLKTAKSEIATLLALVSNWQPNVCFEESRNMNEAGVSNKIC